MIGEKNTQFGIHKLEKMKLYSRATSIKWVFKFDAHARETRKVGKARAGCEKTLEIVFDLIVAEYVVGNLKSNTQIKTVIL